MPLVEIEQIKRLFVTFIANIKSLSVGIVNAPGPGNLTVENDATVGKDLHVENDLTVDGTIIGGETPSYKTGENPGGGSSLGSNPDGTWKVDPDKHRWLSDRNDQGAQPTNDYHYGGGWTTLGNGLELAWGWFHSATDGTVGIRYNSNEVSVPYRNDPAGPSYHHFPNFTLSVTFDVPGTIGNIDAPYSNYHDNPAPGSPGVHRRQTSPHPPGPPDSYYHNHFQPLSRKGFTYNRLNEMDGIVVVHWMALGF